MSTFVVDTHVLVWYLDKDKKLSKNAEKAVVNKMDASYQ